MPKATVNTSRPSQANPIYTPASTTQPNVLKRNQACHQCRRRKLKCDAKRPCSTCLRSFNHQLAHPQPGVVPPSAPDCTFDDVVESTSTHHEGPRNKYERLEHRINELEALLRQKEEGGAAREPDGNMPSHPTLDSHPPLASVTLPTRDSDNSSSVLSRSPAHYTIPSLTTVDPSLHSSGLEVVWSSWPSGLPNSELLSHLVDVFFTFHPHANRMFHVPTFMHSLQLSVRHPKFPCAPVLHAICAIGSLYTAAVTSPPPPNYNVMAPDEIFFEKYRAKEQRVDSFAEQQAKLAKETAEKLNAHGENLFQVFQAYVLLTWFYWSHGRWVDVFLLSAHAMRIAVPLGLNVCPPFHSIANSLRPASILPSARTVIEDETRRNAFWLAYAVERCHGSGNGWALAVDDQDVSQMMPVKGIDFEQGNLVSAAERQWAQSPGLLLDHPESQTDSFILYIKGTILLSRVKTFNARFRSKHFVGEPSAMPVYSECDPSGVRDSVDPRGSAAFIELEHIVTSFKDSFPKHLREPICNNIIDNHLYTTFLMSHVAMIVLHDPHAEVQESVCISALKILTSARAILDLIYNVWTTSFDISLLDTFCAYSWFIAGRVFVRFLKTAIDVGSQEQIENLRGELDFIHSAISKVGQRIPLAHRCARMLEDHIVKSCGVAPAKSLPLFFSARKAEDWTSQGLDMFNGGLSLVDGLHDPFMS